MKKKKIKYNKMIQLNMNNKYYCNNIIISKFYFYFAVI